ncbi:MAG: site-2 protease family protein [Bacillota bacterium]|nr:site-2 protease family protein [Bacillota bacterium]MDD3298266.1 site-2 protease family protein [Bacillota bacterium]MDD3851389.1 site-2 protease family protein [Bacillota bacterium]MDD4707815.1 site-2 protease family protein [Bacillota bacterium]
MFGMDIRNLIYIFPAVIIVLTLHEYSHAKVSDILGDPTPRNRGRLTLNPIAHIDPLGLLMLLLIRLGWAKPVPTNPIYYKDRKRGTLYVALAGPFSGIVLALVVRIILASGLFRWTVFMVRFLNYLYFYSLVISVFNLLPVYPLDGSRILQGLLPGNRGYKLVQYQNQIQIVFMLVIFLANRLLWAVLNPVIGIIDFVITAVAGLLF